MRVVTVETKQLCTPKNWNLPKTYLPTYLCDSSYSSYCIGSSDISDSSEGSDNSNQKKTFVKKIKNYQKKISQKKLLYFFLQKKF